jgi:hypothetical protein
MPVTDKHLADQLERLRHTLLALETYMAQVRDVVAHTRALMEQAQAERPASRRRRRTPAK